MPIDKNRFISHNGIPLTQGLFLEVGYNEDHAVYTLKDFDYTYNGVVYPSIKRLYLEAEDPVEYSFATENFLSWDHWQRICNNRLLAKHVEKWRIELELKLRSQAIRNIIDMTADEKGFQAAKYVAGKEWDKRGAGRPKKDTSAEEAAIERSLHEEFKEDAARLKNEFGG